MKRALPILMGVILITNISNAQSSNSSVKTSSSIAVNYFNAQGDGQSIRLQWESANHNQSDHFNLMRSADGIQYTIIETISADGNSDVATSYNSTDVSPLEGRNYYRLQEIKLDGTAGLSKVIIVGYRSPAKLQVYPNPATTMVQMNVGAHPAGQSLKLRLYTSDGAQIDSRTIRAEDGQTVSWNVSSLKTGSYFFKLEGEERQMRFLKK